MNKVVAKKVSELVDVFNNIRVPLSSKQRETLAKIYPYYGAQGIVDYVDDYLFDGEYIPIAEDGENLKSNNQNICNIVQGKFWVNNHAHIVRANAKNSTKYLFYNFNRIKFEPYVTGSSQPKLNKENLLNIKAYVHENLNDQKSIAKVLSDLDAKIELNNRINRELEAMAKTLYDYWFVQFDFPFDFAQGKPNEQGEVAERSRSYKSSGGKMVYNAELKREIPEGWEVGYIGNYCPSSGGFAFKSSWWSNEGISVVKIKDIQEDYTIDISNLAKVDLTDKKIDDKFKAKPGDILIAMTGATVGKYGIVPITDYPIYVNQRVGYFNLGNEPTEKLPYLINSLNQPYFREMIFSLASGAAQPNISNEQINRISLIIPDRTIVNKYNLKFAPFYKTILNNQRQNQQLTELRDWLLPMLMNGQVVSTSSTSSDASTTAPGSTSILPVPELVEGMAAEPGGEYKKG